MLLLLLIPTLSMAVAAASIFGCNPSTSARNFLTILTSAVSILSIVGHALKECVRSAWAGLAKVQAAVECAVSATAAAAQRPRDYV